MGNMFRHYPQPDDYKPDNYPKFKCPKKLEIMTGETTIHSFDIPFNIEDSCSMVEVIYKSGHEPIIIKNNMFYLDILTEEDGTSIVSCKLTPEETLLFSTLLEAFVQLKFYMNDGSITYSEIYKVFIRNSLDAINRKDKPFPPDDVDAEDDSDGEQIALGGYGYTED